MSKRLISIVTPVYNEEENVERCYQSVQVQTRLFEDRYQFEHIFTDNHSQDDTFARLAQIAAQDNNVRVFRFSRNFGYQRSIYDGLMRSRGDAVIQFDGDLQDPPELIGEFIRQWEAGNQVVYGIRIKRREGYLDQMLRKLFYFILNRLSRERLPQDAGDFRLIDKCIVEELRKVKDSKIYLRGRIAEMGFNQKGIPYERNARTHGRSKFNFRRNLALAIDAMLSHTNLPLRFSVYFGLSVFMLSVLATFGYLVVYFTMGSDWPRGFTTLVIFLLFQLGLTSLFLGVLGEYVARIYDHLKVPQDVILERAIDSTK